jgi:hypothetical protein
MCLLPGMLQKPRAGRKKNSAAGQGNPTTIRRTPLFVTRIITGRRAFVKKFFEILQK